MPNPVVNFIYSTVGLEAKFTNISINVPSGYSYKWDFGDGTFLVSNTNPEHTYTVSGFYLVTLSVVDEEGSPVQPITPFQDTLLVSEFSKTHLSGSIYNLIDTYLPYNIFGTLSYSIKRQFIEKWQLYIQPLVNHEVPIEFYSNELYYEALENQLIMELAAYDYMILEITNMFNANAASVRSNNSSSEEDIAVSDSDDGVKSIKTGPTEVEYFDPNSNDADITTSIAKGLQSGGFIDTLKQNLCMLASRLDIYLPICSQPFTVVVPKVVNRRVPGLLGGPDPVFPLKR